VGVFCWVAQTKSVLSDWCLDDIVAEILVFEGPVRFYLFRQWFE
jgi:hypothetical protein